MNIAYVRVSSVDQNEARQKESLEKYNIEEWFEEKITAKNTNRPKLQEMLKFARRGDTIYIHDLSRLARSTKDLLNLIEILESEGITLVSNKENIDTSTPMGRFFITMIGAINELERVTLLERQREGIAIAKAAGKYKGRKPVRIAPVFFEEQYSRYLRREISKAQLTKILGVTRPTTDKLIAKYKAEHTLNAVTVAAINEARELDPNGKTYKTSDEVMDSLME